MTAPHAASNSGRTKTLALVGLGVVLVAFVASRFLLGGGDGNESTSNSSATTRPRAASPVTVAPVTPAADPSAAPAAPGAPAAPTVETFEVFTTKNPFQPLRVKAAPAAATKPAPAPAPAAVAPTPVAVAPTPVVLPVASATTATGGQATEPVRATRVALVDVFSEGGRVVANVRVNDTVSKVGAGDSFGGNFKVVSLDEAARCGRFLYGDDQFRMCRGEELLK